MDARATPVSEFNCRTIVDTMSEGAIVQLADGQIYSANPSAERILGATQKQMKELAPRDWPWQLTHEDGSPFSNKSHPSFKALRTGKACHNVVGGITRQDGSHIWVSINAEPLSNGDESGPYAVVTTFADISELKQRELEIQQLNMLTGVIRRINEHLLVTNSEQELYHFICDSLSQLEHVVAVWVGLTGPDTSISPAAWSGIDSRQPASDLPDGEHPMVDCRMLAQAIAEHAPVIVENLGHDPRFPQLQHLREWNVVSGAAIPLYLDGTAIGGLTIVTDHAAFFNESSTKFLGEVADDIAVGVKSLRLGHRLAATLSNLQKSLDATISTIAGIVEYRDPYTAGHEHRVAQLACAIGQELGLPERQIDGLRVAGHIHDLGKIAVPAEILSKPSRLTEVEFQLVREHALIGYNLLRNLEFPWPIAQAVLQHHERLDGSGYPHGLRGDEIIFEARILMIADVVEAISGHRPYRPALGVGPALIEIKSNRGKFYDPQAADACLTLFEQRKFDFADPPPHLM
jgi:PAS domain S-box-containing protein